MQTLVDIGKEAAENTGSFEKIYDELTPTPSDFPAFIPFRRSFPQMAFEDGYTYTGEQTAHFAIHVLAKDATWEEAEAIMKAWAKEAITLNSFFRLLSVPAGYIQKIKGKKVRILEVEAALNKPWDID